jgi:hypothetical protein
LSSKKETPGSSELRDADETVWFFEEFPVARRTQPVAEAAKGGAGTGDLTVGEEPPAARGPTRFSGSGLIQKVEVLHA